MWKSLMASNTIFLVVLSSFLELRVKNKWKYADFRPKKSGDEGKNNFECKTSSRGFATRLL